MSLQRNFAIFSVIMQKNIRQLFAHLPGLLLDCLSPALGQLIMYGYLFSILGMPNEMVGALYLGGMLPLFFQLGYSLTMHTSFDLESNKYIDYQITLPISKTWLFATFIVTNMLETALAIIPMLTLGMALLPNHFVLARIDWLGLMFVFPLILLCLSSFFLVIAFRYELWWIRNNFWPRRMFPLFFVSASLVPWHLVNKFWPTLSYVMLLSPLTYVSEGLRVTLLGNAPYIAAPYCIIALCLFTALHIALLVQSVHSKLDPV